MKPENYLEAFQHLCEKSGNSCVDVSFDMYRFGIEKKYVPVKSIKIDLDEDNRLVFDLDDVIIKIPITRGMCFQASTHEETSLVGISNSTIELYLRVRKQDA